MTTTPQSRPIINPYLAVLVGVFAVSFSALFVRLTTAPPLIIATYRLLFTFLLLAPATAASHFSGVRSMSRREIALSAASGVFLALHFVTWFTSLFYTSVASSVVIVTMQPVFVVVGAWLFFREKVPRLALLGGVVALCGSIVIGAGDFQLGMRAFVGDLLALAAAVFVSGYLLIGRKLRGNVELSGYTFVTYGASSLVLVSASFLSRTPFHPYPPLDWLLFFALAAVCTVLGHTVFNWVLRYVQASVVSVSILGEPIGAIVWASLFLGESPTLRQVAGGSLIFAGLYIFTRVSARNTVGRRP
ncbi:DMT family transporter [Geobacter sulfurreducens]|uniref:DMT family transporter n=1 Tax=Geobacter sulfurreducens TaxID=35554 RepID=UPI001BDC3630|nr:DMT family transporter [Geobacter sulfurreducens]QVW35200.1 DMT family transporter [Geobacter sulfurreducens]